MGDVRGLPSTCETRALSTHPYLSSGVLDCLSQRLLPALERPVPLRGIPATSGPAWSQTVS